MNRNPLGLVKIPPDDKHCNARTKTGYCKHTPGWRTSHPGTGRCNYHGGEAGRPITIGLYSKRMKLTLKEQISEIVKDPQFSSMYEEFAQLKMVLMNIVGDLPEDFGKEMFKYDEVLCRACGGVVLTPSEAKKRVELMLDVIDRLSRTHERLVKTSVLLNKVITMDQLQYVYRQIAKIIFDATKDKGAAESVMEQLQEIPLFFDPTNALSKSVKKKAESVGVDGPEIENAEFEEIEDNEDLVYNEDEWANPEDI